VDRGQLENKHKMKKIRLLSYIALVAVVLASTAGWYLLRTIAQQGPQASPTPAPFIRKLRVRDATISVELAWTAQQQEKGLSDRSSLEPDTGMLFIFPKPGIYAFWMKDMHFPIDIVWIADDNVIIGYVEDAKPESFPKAFPPPRSIRYALEVNAGFVKQYKIHVGDVIKVSDLDK